MAQGDPVIIQGYYDASGVLQPYAVGAPGVTGAVTVADGASVALGAKADAAIVTNATGSISGKLRGLVALIAGLSKGSGVVDATTLRVITASDGPLNVAMGTKADAPVASGDATMIAALKGLGVAIKATAVTKSDSTVLTGVRGLYVGGTGDVAVLMVGDTVVVTLTAVPAGTVLPLAVQKVMSTNTTATALIALY